MTVNFTSISILCLFIARLNIQYPMLFKLTNTKVQRETHCGVLEFVADEGRVYLPYWVCYAPTFRAIKIIFYPSAP